MEKENKRIMYEGMLLNDAFNNELEGYGDSVYSQYHVQNAEWFMSFIHRLNEIVDYKGQTADDFVKHVSNIILSPEQRRALVELRKEPMYIKLMGETALQQKQELEGLLGVPILLQGKTFAGPEYPSVAMKTEKELESELDTFSDKLAELLSTGAISQEQYDKYDQMLDYIYGYYISSSRGDQIPFRKMTNEEYKKVEERAQENGVAFDEQLRQETADLQEEHAELQELQGGGSEKIA